MLYDKKQALKRCDKYHDIKGSVYKALEEVLSSPKGNLVVEFAKKMIGKPYGAKSMNMDKVVDCAEFTRILFYIFFGKDIGSWSDGQLYDRDGKTIGNHYDDLASAPILSVVLYKTSKRKRTGHAALKIDSNHIIHSGAKEHKKKVGISDLYWGKSKYRIVAIRQFISDEELASVIVGNEPPIEESEEYDMLKHGSKGRGTYLWQHTLKRAGYTVLKPNKKWADMETGEVNGCDGIFGDWTELVTIDAQGKHGLPKTGVVDPITYGCVVSEIDTVNTEEMVKLKEQNMFYASVINDAKADLNRAS